MIESPESQDGIVKSIAVVVRDDTEVGKRSLSMVPPYSWAGSERTQDSEGVSGSQADQPKFRG
jgi:hypothetical protein